MEYIGLNWKDEYIKFDSQDTEYKAPYGAVPCGDKIFFKIKINEKAMPEKVTLHIWKITRQIQIAPKMWNILWCLWKQKRRQIIWNMYAQQILPKFQIFCSIILN